MAAVKRTAFAREHLMNRSIFVSSLCVVGAALGLATFSGDASAYTRSVCGLAGRVDNEANWAFGNCAAKNASSGIASIRFAIPLDSSSNVGARVVLDGSAWSTGTVQLITFNDYLYYSIGNAWATSGTSVIPQAIYTESLPMVGTTGAATLIATVQSNRLVYDAMVWN
jgi:hypothetical protein